MSKTKRTPAKKPATAPKTPKKPKPKKRVHPTKHPGVIKTIRGHIRWAAQFGSTADVQRHLDAGTSADELDGETSALQMACSHKKPAIVKLLLDAGANPNHAGGGMTPLLYAVSSKSTRTLEMVKLLLAAGADPTTNGFRDTTLVEWCARDPKLADVTLALEAAIAAKH